MNFLHCIVYRKQLVLFLKLRRYLIGNWLQRVKDYSKCSLNHPGGDVSRCWVNGDWLISPSLGVELRKLLWEKLVIGMGQLKLALIFANLSREQTSDTWLEIFLPPGLIEESQR